MTVDDLRKAIQHLPDNLKVEIALPDDEFNATCLTHSRNYLRICKDNSEISVAETVLHDDYDQEEDA